MSEDSKTTWSTKLGVMLGVQVGVYLLFAVFGGIWAGLSVSGADAAAKGIAALSSGVAPALIAAMLLVLFWFHANWPFRATLVDRAIGVIVGLLSVLAVSSPLMSIYGISDELAGDPLKLRTYPMERWAAAVAGLLVLLTIVSFARQMARENRSHLIRALSHCVTGGAASISLAGWFYLPYVAVAGRAAFATGGAGDSTGAGVSANGGVSAAVFIGVVVAMVLFAVILAVASVWWLDELDPDPKTRSPWIGVALLPVMFYGLVVFAAALFLQLV